MNTNKKTLIASGSLLALSIMMVAGLSFASAHGGAMFQNLSPAEKAEMMDERLIAHAELLEITPEALKTRLDDGESFKEIAESFGLTKDDMEAHMKASATEHIEQLLADGEITEEKAEEMLERLENGNFKRGHKKGFHRGFHGDHNQGMDRPTMPTEE